MSDDAALRNLSFNQARALGATYVRAMVLMHMLHPCRGVEAFKYLLQLARLVEEARLRNMKVQLVLTGVAANWGVPRGCTGPFLPTGERPDLKNWAKFVNNIVSFFAAKPRNVRRFSLWNEPNHPSFLCNGNVVPPADGNIDKSKCNAPKKTSASLLVSLYKTGYNVIQKLKAKGNISKNVKVFFGELAGADLTFIDNVFKNNKLKADGFSFHPYQYCTPPEVKTVPKNAPCKRAMKGISYIPDVQAKLAKLHKSGHLTTPSGGRVPLYLTEFGYFQKCNKTNDAAKLGMCVFGLPSNLRALWYPRALQFAAKHGAKGFVLYQFLQSKDGSWNTALLNNALQSTAAYCSTYAWAKHNKYPVRSFLKGPGKCAV